MDTAGLLLRDPLFWAAAVVFLGASSIFLWSLAGLNAARIDASFRAVPSLASRSFPAPMSPPADRRKGWSFPPPEQPPALPPDVEATVKLPAASAAKPTASSLPSKNDPALVLSVMEDKFAELAKKISSLESGGGGGKKDHVPPSYLDPLLKRVQDMEAELKNMKFAFTQLAAAQNAININDLTSKIHGIQKVLESLTGGTDVSKPS